MYSVSLHLKFKIIHTMLDPKNGWNSFFYPQKEKANYLTSNRQGNYLPLLVMEDLVSYFKNMEHELLHLVLFKTQQ